MFGIAACFALVHSRMTCDFRNSESFDVLRVFVLWVGLEVRFMEGYLQYVISGNMISMHTGFWRFSGKTCFWGVRLCVIVVV